MGDTLPGLGGAGLSPLVERSPEEVGTRRKISPVQPVRRVKPQLPASRPEPTRTSRRDLELVRQSNRTMDRRREEAAAANILAKRQAVFSRGHCPQEILISDRKYL